MMGAPSSLCAGKPAEAAGAGYGIPGCDARRCGAQVAARGTIALLEKTGFGT